ncbi:LysR family transcriptional regulator [Methylobacterium sp. CCH7-A2]|jgi:DNA-binding transcriptional LysR family regulator|uniref:LysR family transcriptional regulator n=1 Tax=Methylobacterium sp. CCH7-A2 TaxID=1768789 RepID=UPI000836B20E|nr:LysR family transcriptional regulator [Methylobacterium sp. CCH7-A2]
MHQIRYFLAVARTLNFTRAAEQCNVTQPSLTRSIQKLETELGGLLLHRERQHTHLTELGRLMLPHLERTFTAAQAAQDLARDVSKGEMAPLRIGLSETISSKTLIGLLEGLKAFVSGFELTLAQLPNKDLINRALDGSFDLIFLSDTQELPDRMRSWILFRETFRLIMPADHSLASLALVPISALAGLDIVAPIDCPDLERFKTFCASSNIDLRCRHKVHGADQLQRLVSSGFGCGFLPANMPLIEGLVARDLAESDTVRQVVVAIVAGRPFATATDACLRLARSRDWVTETARAAAPHAMTA